MRGFVTTLWGFIAAAALWGFVVIRLMVVHGFVTTLWGVIAAALCFVVILLIVFVVRGLVTTVRYGGHNNSINNGINGKGSNNDSGNNSMFSNASYFNINGGEFTNSGRDTTKNIYNNHGGTRNYTQNIETSYGNANQGENQRNSGSIYNRGNR